jgi:hypothetical protein
MRNDDFADLRLNEFFAAVENSVRLRQVPFEWRELQDFMATMRPLVTEGDSVEWWAEAFLEAMAAEHAS